jgi:glycosyltransferase involved in cell wall biosynthesis
MKACWNAMRILSVRATKVGKRSNKGENFAFWKRVNSIEKILRSAGHNVNTVDYKWINFPSSILSVHVGHLKRLLHENYDLVYGNDYGGTFFSLLGKLTDKPLFFDMHGASYEEIMLARNDRGLFFLSAFAGNKIVDFLNSHASNRIFCASRKMRNYLIIEKGISSEKIIYLPNGVDLNFFKNVMNSDTRRIKERIGKKFLFGYIGGLQKYQGLESFIQAAEKILESDIAFLVVGAQHSYKKNNIHFFTKVPYSKIVNYYALCDAFILPRPSHISLEIAAPTKFSEYCAMGKPILTTNVGDPADLVKRYK